MGFTRTRPAPIGSMLSTGVLLGIQLVCQEVVGSR